MNLKFLLILLLAVNVYKNSSLLEDTNKRMLQSSYSLRDSREYRKRRRDLGYRLHRLTLHWCYGESLKLHNTCNPFLDGEENC